MHMMWSCDFSG